MAEVESSKIVEASSAGLPNKDLSAYEINRARNIEKNNARLRALGLISAREEVESNASAWKISPPGRTAKDGDNDKENKNAKTRKRKTPSSNDKSESPQAEGMRKSLRLKGLQPDGISEALPPSPRKSMSAEELKQLRAQRREECREARQRAALEHAALGAAKAAKENPTATYEHCLMRVRTMTEKGLANRIKVIERASGKHCVIKMAIMASCLKDEGLWELAELASESLERLKALKPPPPKE